jgi:hypothetical protein
LRTGPAPRCASSTERRHIHTILFEHLGATYRDADPVPVELALDARYDGLIILWMDGRNGRPAAELIAELSTSLLPQTLAGSNIEIASSWTPWPGENDERPNVPMDLGSPAGGPERAVQLFFIRGDVTEAVGPLRAYTHAIEDAGLADIQLVAPFYATRIGTDAYVDELW